MLGRNKRHLQCAEQQASTSNLTKYCACHAKVNLMIDPHHIWNVIYNARSNRHHPPTSPNTAPATQNECHDWSASHMKRHLQCGEQQASTSNLTKYCACHAKWMSWLSHITDETSFTMRGATATPSNLTKYCACHAKWPPKISDRKLAENSWHVPFPMRDRSENIRAWSETVPTQKTQTATRRAAKATFRTGLEQILLENYNVSRSMLSFQISPHAAPATKSDTWTSPNAAPATKSDTWTSANAAPATKSDTWTSPNAAPATKSDTWTSPNAAPAMKSDTWTSPNYYYYYYYYYWDYYY